VVISTGSGTANLNPTSSSSINASLEMDYPDLTVAGFISPSREDKNASVNIKNTGIEIATNVTVRFEVSKYREIEITGKKGYRQITKEGAANIRVHFDWLDARDGWLEIKRNLTDEVPVVRYNGDTYSGWSPWVEGDTIWIFCNLKNEYIIDAWGWGEIVDVRNVTITASESVPVHIPSQWGDEKNYTQPRRLKVTVDPDNIITESEEGNNNRTGVMYIDLEAEDLTFVSPDESHLCVHAEHNIIRATIKNNNETEGIVFPTGGDKLNFDVALEVSDLNGTVVYRRTENSNAKNSTVLFDFPHADKMLYAGEEVNVTFIEGKIYPDFVGDTKGYKVSIIADYEGVIDEDNDLYPQGEGNNETSKTVTVYHMSGYTGGDLDTVIQGKVYGDMIYSIGNSKYDSGDVSFSDVKSQIPGNANITEARLYLYWLFWDEHDFADVDMQFNGEPVSPIRTYYDDTIATKFATRWGTYVYDVTDEVKDVVAHGGNYAANAEIYDAKAHCTGMGLLIVYESEDKPLIKYGIAEGTWTLMADNEDYPTGLLPEQCTATATFAGVENNTEVSKAELLTVLASWKEEDLSAGVTIGDALLFNGRDVGTPRGRSYWKYEGDGCMALTSPNWVNINLTDLKSSRDNLAEIQSRGNYMTATNAILKVTYQPDPTFDTGPSKNPYPSIFGVHEGTILLNHTITANKLYTYPCAGTGGHSGYVEIYNESGTIAKANWTGYTSDYHNITFPQVFTLHAREKYNYAIITGSYPQIIHQEQNHTTSNGYINCTSFVDANGKKYIGWIPAVRLWKG